MTRIDHLRIVTMARSPPSALLYYIAPSPCISILLCQLFTNLILLSLIHTVVAIELIVP